MPRISVPTRDEAPAESQPILDSVGKQLGFIPNLHRLMSLSPAALTGLVGLQGALSKTLDLRTRDAISLAVSEANACNYCLAASPEGFLVTQTSVGSSRQRSQGGLVHLVNGCRGDAEFGGSRTMGSAG